MSRIVDSVLNLFGKRSAGKDKDPRPRSRKGRSRRSLLAADSFVFLPGQVRDQEAYWGEVLQSRDYSTISSQIVEDNSVHTELRRRAQTADESALRAVITRRLSGTLLKARSEVEDGSQNPQHEGFGQFLDPGDNYKRKTETRPRSDDPSSERYVYDRLVHVPKRNSDHTDSSRGSVQSQNLRDSNLIFEIRCSDQAPRARGGSSGYCDIVPVGCAEYTMPLDTIDWENVRRRTRIVEGDYATVREPSTPVLGRNIDPREIVLSEKIGEGQFGDVHKGILHPGTTEHTTVAIKTCKPDASHEDRAKFLEEAAVMNQFSHPHIIKLFGVMSQDSCTYIIMELAPLGQLRRYLLTEGIRISKAMLLSYVHQLASAMVHLEAKNYVHRDIAARNVLVTAPNMVKLADFGLSRGLEDGDYYVASRGKLPIKWMSPESINFRRFTSLSDVWMFGVCCWEILMRGIKPFVGIKNDEVISKIELGERLPLPPDCPAPLFGLMNMCWQYDPMDRPHFNTIESTINDIVQEEYELDMFNQRRNYGAIQRDPNAPDKPWRPPSTQPMRPDSHTKRYSAVSSADSTDLSRRYSNHVDDHAPSGKLRDLSMSPHPPPDRLSPPSYDAPPTKPPRSVNASRSAGNIVDRNKELPLPPGPLPPTPAPIEPYFVTTITPVDSDLPHSHLHRDRHSESPIPAMTAPIPPPSIIRQPPRPLSNHSGDGHIYYSTPAELAERGLTDDGVFADRESRGSSQESGRFGHGRPLSHASRGGSSRDSPTVDEDEDVSFLSEDDDIVQQTTAVVKAVMELSNKVPLSRPNDYVELVKNVLLALRELLSLVDDLFTKLPQDLHLEVSMAHKVLAKDMTDLVEAMKNAQKHYQTFVQSEYQKQMLHAAHVVAMNSKQLLDAVNTARRKATLR